MGLAQSIVNADNDEVRVTTWTFEAAGAATGQHRHEFDYVVVPITGGRFEGRSRRLGARDGPGRGSPYLGTAGTAHDVVSAADRKWYSSRSS